MYFGEQMWVVLNVVEPGMDQNALDAVERQRLQLESQHQLDALIGSFSHMQSDNQVCRVFAKAGHPLVRIFVPAR